MPSAAPLPGEEPAWPSPSAERTAFLVDASSGLEARLLESWIDRHRPEGIEAPDCEAIALPPSRRRRRNATLERLEARLASGQDALLAPLRVVWLPEERHGKRTVRFANLLTLGDPRDPGPLRQAWILRRHPDRCRIVAGEPARISELKERWQKAVGSHREQTMSLADFVARQAMLASERAERKLRGARYKVPRLVHEDILGRPAFRGGAARLARELDRSEADVLTEMSRNLREIAATHSPFVIDLVAPLIRWLYTQGYEETVQYDPAELGRLMALAQRHPVVLLPSHKSNLDHLVLQYVLYENGHPPNHTAGGINMNFFPIGPLVRRSGVFFIRRSFRDDRVYKFVLRHYIDYLIEKRFSLEWYIEGGRSRSGKLLPPRFGMLAYVVDAYRRAKSEDVLLLPVSIAYDQIPDVGSYAAEQTGAASPCTTAPLRHDPDPIRRALVPGEGARRSESRRRARPRRTKPRSPEAGLRGSRSHQPGHADHRDVTGDSGAARTRRPRSDRGRDGDCRSESAPLRSASGSSPHERAGAR
jgi:glycerol-3-phosphate O-acyltransferase